MDFKSVLVILLVSRTTIITSTSTVAVEKEKSNKKFFSPMSSEDYVSYEDLDIFEEHGKIEPEDSFRLNNRKLDIDDEYEKMDEIDQKRAAHYEVTEDIEDIPDNSTVKAPILTNYTISVPLNNATAQNNLENSNSNENNESGNNIGAKRNTISILHITAEIGGTEKPVTIVQNFGGFKDYVQGVRQGLLNGIRSFVKKHTEANTEVTPAHNVVNSPIYFFNKLHSKSAEALNKVHEGLFGK